MHSAYIQVFAQVSKLFGGAPDLIDGFRQFLPESNGGPSGTDQFGSVLAAANEPLNALSQKRASKDVAPPLAAKKRRAPEPKALPQKVSLNTFIG